MPSPSVALIGNAPPTLRLAPDGLNNPQADDAIDYAGIAGLELFAWQADALRDSMRLAPSGRWAAREVGIVVSRQNGKGSILEARQLAGLFVLGERLQVHSAHEFKTCYEHFRRVKALIENCPLLAEQVKIIRTGAGDQAIELKNGCRIRFIARSRSSGRGFSADAVYLDEAFNLDDRTIGALLPALSARPNPQIWYTSSAAHADSEVLHRVRQRAMDGDAGLMVHAWEAAPDVDPRSPEAWASVNPSFGLLLGEEDIAAEQRAMSPDEFARERLGIPEAPEGSESWLIVPEAIWTAMRGDSAVSADDCWALEVSPDRKYAALGLAGRNAEGRVHVECVHWQPGTSWVEDIVVGGWERRRVPIRIAPSSAAGSFIAPLRERGVEVVEVPRTDVAAATGRFVDLALAGQLAHLGQASLDKAVRGAGTTETDGARVWADKTSSTDITPLRAVTVALTGVSQIDGRPVFAA